MHTDSFRLFQPCVCAAVRSIYLSVRDYLQPDPMHTLSRQMEIRSCTGERVRELHWKVQLALTETTLRYPDSYKTTLNVGHDTSPFGQLTGSVPVLVSLSFPGKNKRTDPPLNPSNIPTLPLSFPKSSPLDA